MIRENFDLYERHLLSMADWFQFISVTEETAARCFWLQAGSAIKITECGKQR